MILYFVRHGEPIYDPDSLTPLGHEQAKALSMWGHLPSLEASPAFYAAPTDANTEPSE